ncbi:hypothetical protein VC180_19955 [Citrobacter braakii]|uniref:hypothetical protein n=1 Tax=Citrobacter braakii TaxID=57706 RepID=UPI002B3E67E6|nr:hypothetical protein [Citrobacter braakii]MEB2724645.1 hypothetical protein [Citrobacter braakii]
MKIVMFMILLVFSFGGFAKQNDNEDIKSVRLFIAKTKYLVSRFDNAINLYSHGESSSLLALNKDMNDLYHDGVARYGMSVENGFKVSPFSDCSTMSTAAYNLWQEKKNTLTDNDKNLEALKLSYLNAYHDCKKTTLQPSAHEDKNDDKITIIDVE